MPESHQDVKYKGGALPGNKIAEKFQQFPTENQMIHDADALPVEMQFKPKYANNIEDAIKMNQTDFFYWCMNVIGKYPHTKLGQKLTLAAFQKMTPQTESESERNDNRLFKNLHRLPVKILKKLEAGTISPDKIFTDENGDYSILDDEDEVEVVESGQAVQQPEEEERPTPGDL